MLCHPQGTLGNNNKSHLNRKCIVKNLVSVGELELMFLDPRKFQGRGGDTDVGVW